VDIFYNDLFLRCLVRDPKDRATIEELLEINSQPVIPRKQEAENSDRPSIRSLSTRSGSVLVNEELFALNPQPLTPRRQEDDRRSVRSLSTRSGSMLVNVSTHLFSGLRQRSRRNLTMNPIDNLHKVVRQRSYEYIKCKKEIDAHNNSILCMKLMKKRRRITSESNVDYGGLQQLVTGSRDGV
jgi:serine/threonine protein kinase